MRCLVVSVLAALVSSSLGQNLTIHTQQGLVTGTLVNSRVRRFLGIPYAVASRWQAPQLPPARTTTFLATGFGNACLQQLSRTNKEFLNLFGLSTQVVQQSESCLSVNIWSPSLNRKQSTAVMIWIHGGGYEFGTSDTIFYDGTNLVGHNDDVLLVTLNYRTNIFGFPGTSQLRSTTQSQNFGALDVAAAIQWVHSNIAAFGGDPNRITLFGQSAGAGLISAYTFSHPTDTIVKGIIEESGSLAGMPSFVTTFGRPLDTSPWTAVSTIVGCGNVSTAAQLACMRTVPATTLSAATVRSHLDFVPVQDGITFFADATARSAAGKFLHVPLLVGNTAEEADIFITTIKNINPTINNTALLNQGGDLITAIAFTCTAGITAANYVTAGVPVWRYRYEGVFPDISTSGLRAYHASEIPLVFGTFASSSFGGAPTSVEIALSSFIQRAWVAFARNPQTGLTSFGWPRYNPSTASLAQLGNATKPSGVTFSTGNLFDRNCQLDVQEIELILGLLVSLGVIP